MPADRQRFRRRLLKWYRANGRDLPWRNTSDPYHILVSEIMLQQTQVDRVLPKYEEWLTKYPSLQALADAPEAERHRKLAAARLQHPAAAAPRDRARVGRATAASCRPTGDFAIVQGDWKYRRRGDELRLRAAGSDPRHQRRARPLPELRRPRRRRARAMKRHLWDVAHGPSASSCVRLQPGADSFGATLCTARKPKCLICPMQSGCKAYPFNPDNEQP